MMLLHLGSLLGRAIELSIHGFGERVQYFLSIGSSGCSVSLVGRDFFGFRIKISEAIEINDILPDELSSWYRHEDFFQTLAFHVYNMKIICCT